VSVGFVCCVGGWVCCGVLFGYIGLLCVALWVFCGGGGRVYDYLDGGTVVLRGVVGSVWGLGVVGGCCFAG